MSHTFLLENRLPKALTLFLRKLCARGSFLPRSARNGTTVERKPRINHNHKLFTYYNILLLLIKICGKSNLI